MARLYDTGGRILWSSREPGVSGTLANASLNGADLSRLRLSDVAIEGQLLSYLKLDGTVFSNVRFHKVDLHSASLVAVRFIDCQLNDVNLQRADMTRSVMTTPSDRVAIECSIFHGTEPHHRRLHRALRASGARFSTATRSKPASVSGTSGCLRPLVGTLRNSSRQTDESLVVISPSTRSSISESASPVHLIACRRLKNRPRVDLYPTRASNCDSQQGSSIVSTERTVIWEQ